MMGWISTKLGSRMEDVMATLVSAVDALPARLCLQPHTVKALVVLPPGGHKQAI